jgi:excisionase family DNA binding protein
MDTVSENRREAALTVRDVCAELRLSRNTVYGLINSGQLAAFRAGKQRFRIEPEALRRYKQDRMASRDARMATDVGSDRRSRPSAAACEG